MQAINNDKKIFNKTLSEFEVSRFIEGCPSSINTREFMALVCLMSEHYGIEMETLQEMCVGQYTPPFHMNSKGHLTKGIYYA